MKNAHLYWHEASGLDPSNRLVYIVEKGDSPILIAKKLVGDGNRWRELIKANPNKKLASNGNFASLGIGERINVPVSWEQAMTKTTPSGGAVVVPAAVDPAPGPIPSVISFPGMKPAAPAAPQPQPYDWFVPTGPQTAPAPAPLPEPVPPPPGGATPSVQPSSVVSTISTTPAATDSPSPALPLLTLGILGVGAYYLFGRGK